MKSEPVPPSRSLQRFQFASAMIVLFVMVSYGAQFPYFSVAFLIAVALVNLAVLAVRRWRSASAQVDAIFDEELGRE